MWTLGTNENLIFDMTLEEVTIKGLEEMLEKSNNTIQTLYQKIKG